MYIMCICVTHTRYERSECVVYVSLAMERKIPHIGGLVKGLCIGWLRKVKIVMGRYQGLAARTWQVSRAINR